MVDELGVPEDEREQAEDALANSERKFRLLRIIERSACTKNIDST